MQLGIFAKTFPRPTLEETLDTIVAHGLTHVQFNMSCVGLPTLPQRLDEEVCVGIARAFRERGLTMAAISGTFNLCDPIATRLTENLRKLDALAAACQWLDTRIITLCTGTRDVNDMWKWHSKNVRRHTWDSLTEAVREAVKIAGRHEVTLAFEPELHNVVNSVSKARRLLDEIGSPWLKVVIDPANLLRPDDFPRLHEILEEAFDWLGSDIVLAHAKEPSTHVPDDDALLQPYQKALVGEGIWGLSARVVQQLADIARELGPDGLRALVRCQAFFFPYIEGLLDMNYQGAFIIHGIEEDRAGERVAWLKCALETLLSMKNRT